jgi:hypothetical protein
MHVRVRPGHPEEVYLGGVNLYRSTDGFQTSTHTKHIGGLKDSLLETDLIIGISNQHGDEHDIIFSPSNNKKAITVSDGGIEYTKDITANPIVWESMNAGYMTTQFYTVGQQHNSTSPIVFGGAQDNGSLFVNDLSYTKPWTKPSDGDGMQLFPANAPDEYYICFQYGWLARFKLDANLNTSQVAYITPNKLSSISLFCSPYLVDETNRNRLYFADGQFLQRNDDVTQMPLGNKVDFTPSKIKGWSLMQGCVAPDSSAITQLNYAEAQTDVVYFGTISGKLMRVRQASTANSITENITGSNFPSGYITCITTDPKDSNVVFCVFSNFGILSVFYTSNGGVSWTPVSGNLEQNVNGTGAGPSCRWLTIAHLPDTTIYFLGTSSGLYASTLIQGSNTIWVRQGPHNIGLNWVNMMDFRTTDNTMAVATFGAGIFTSRISSMDHTALRDMWFDNQIRVYPNPVHDRLQFTYPNGIEVTEYALHTITGQLVEKGSLKQEREINMSQLSTGTYILSIVTSQGLLQRKIVKD